MDIYQIIITYYPIWSPFEWIIFLSVLALAVCIAVVLYKKTEDYHAAIHSRDTVIALFAFSIWFYCVYKNAGRAPIPVGGVLVMEEDPALY